MTWKWTSTEGQTVSLSQLLTFCLSISQSQSYVKRRPPHQSCKNRFCCPTRHRRTCWSQRWSASSCCLNYIHVLIMDTGQYQTSPQLWTLEPRMNNFHHLSHGNIKFQPSVKLTGPGCFCGHLDQMVVCASTGNLWLYLLARLFAQPWIIRW